MIAPKYHNRKLNFIKRINNLYLFEDPKTKIKTTFTLVQLAEFNRKAREILVKQNINNNIFYCKDRNKKIEKEHDKKIQKNKVPYSRRKNEYKQILHTKQKTGKSGNNINIYYVEV